MKKLILILLVAISFNAFAQEKITEGILVSKMTMSSDNDEMNAQLAMMGEIEATTYFKDGKSRAESNNPMSGESITITDNETKQMLMLINNPMAGKMYMKQSFEPSKEDLESVSVKKGEDTKTILGYVCNQYFVTTNVQGQAMEMEIFASDALEAYSSQTANFADKIDGFPLYTKITMNQGPAKMIIVNEIADIKKEKVSDDKFDMTVPKGYEEMKQ